MFRWGKAPSSEYRHPVSYYFQTFLMVRVMFRESSMSLFFSIKTLGGAVGKGKGVLGTMASPTAPLLTNSSFDVKLKLTILKYLR